MKTKTYKVFIFKALLIITGITFGFSGLNKCGAQSIEVNGKRYQERIIVLQKELKPQVNSFYPRPLR
jgi:hypothetical protein